LIFLPFDSSAFSLFCLIIFLPFDFLPFDFLPYAVLPFEYSLKMASRAVDDTSSQDFVVSKEVGTDLTSGAMEQILGSIQSLVTTMASQIQGLQRQREEDRLRQNEDRQKQEYVLAQVMAVSKASEKYASEVERRTMDALESMMEHQEDLEAELHSDYELTAPRHPTQSNQLGGFRPRSGPSLDLPPPASRSQSS